MALIRTLASAMNDAQKEYFRAVVVINLKIRMDFDDRIIDDLKRDPQRFVNPDLLARDKKMCSEVVAFINNLIPPSREELLDRFE